jgi:hypothetical protein
MYGNPLDLSQDGDFKIFQDRAKVALQRGGFTDEFVNTMMDWDAFRIDGVWAALKLLNDQFGLLDSYEGTDCCISALVELAIQQEQKLLQKHASLKKNV